MSLDEYPYAEHGKVVTGCEESWSDLDAATAFAHRILRAIEDAKIQREFIEMACRDGHHWSEGSNWQPWYSTEKETFFHCLREGCEATRKEPGWLIPFEPVDHTGYTRWDGSPYECSGPGCELCFDLEAMKMPVIQITRGGIRFPPPAVDQATFEASTKTCEHSGDDFTIAGVCTICGWTDQP